MFADLRPARAKGRKLYKGSKKRRPDIIRSERLVANAAQEQHWEGSVAVTRNNGRLVPPSPSEPGMAEMSQSSTDGWRDVEEENKCIVLRGRKGYLWT